MIDVHQLVQPRGGRVFSLRKNEGIVCVFVRRLAKVAWKNQARSERVRGAPGALKQFSQRIRNRF
jgi:hypothetical protein